MCQIALKGSDVMESLSPDVFRNETGGQLLPFQKLRMDAYNQNFFIVGAVENADSPALRQTLGGAPEKIVIEFLFGRGLEGKDLATLRIDTGHHMFDGAVFARRIHSLKNKEQGPLAIGIEHIL